MRKKWFIVVILILIPLLISCKQTIPSNETTNHTTENKTIENPSTATTPQTTPSTSETIHTEPTTPSINETVNTEPTAIEEPTTPPPVFEPPVYVPTGGIEIIQDSSWWDTPYIEIYTVERYAFDYFLDNPSIDTLHAIYMEKYQNAPCYQTYSYFKFFDIETTLFSFVKDKEKITNFLAENGINMTVEQAMLIDTPYIPMLLWVRGGGENAFITINDITEYDDEYEFVGITYEYECYTVTAFREKFEFRYGSLKANGKDIPNTMVRIYNDDIASDLPLLRVLEAYGAVINRESDHLYIITFHKKQFKLDLKREILYEVGDETEFNLLSPLGGPLIVYPTEHDMMVDTHTLTFALNEMGQKTMNIEDRTNKVVIIKNRDE